MHYIPFINEDKKNTYEVVNCKCCPLFKTELLDNGCCIAYCDYSSGDIIHDTENYIVTLPGRRICPVKYKDPVEDFHYLYIINNFYKELVKICRKIGNEEYKSDEEKESLEKRRDSIMICCDILKDVFPEKEEMYHKIMEGGYKLDDDMNLYKK